ncbi:hypothetical protein P7C70_g1095, partial [Phenoliferia sp. Uapishka_3]
MILSATVAFSILAVLANAAPRHFGHSGNKRYYPMPKVYSQTRDSTFVHLVNPKTAPLTRIAVRNERNQHLHPYMLFQQHLNRSHRRHALMTGREPPTDEHLERLMQKRWHGITGGKQGELKLRKRQRGGEALGKSSSGGPGGANALIGQPGEAIPKNAATWEAVSKLQADSSNNLALANAAGFPEESLNAANAGTVDVAVTPTAAQTSGESIEANDVGETRYFTTMQMGTPPKDYKVLLDSGSSGTGQVSGTLAQDNVIIAGLKVDNHTFGVTTVESQDFGAAGVPFDGLMGLAKSALSSEKVPTPIEVMWDSISLAVHQYVDFHAPRLTSRLAVTDSGPNDGQATFGGIDATKFTGQLTEFANVSPLGFWEGAMSDVQINGKSLNLAGRTAILDTGTTLMVIPQADAVYHYRSSSCLALKLLPYLLQTAIHAAIPGSASDGQGGFAVPCTNTVRPLNIFLIHNPLMLKGVRRLCLWPSMERASPSTRFATFPLKAFGATTDSLLILKADLAFVPVDTNNLAGLCISGIAAGQIGGANEWLVGDVFLKNVYFATDVDANKMGLAPALTAVPATGGAPGGAAPAEGSSAAPVGASSAPPEGAPAGETMTIRQVLSAWMVCFFTVLSSVLAHPHFRRLLDCVSPRSGATWEPSEVGRLSDAVETHAGEWSKIASIVGGGRSASACKNKWKWLVDKALNSREVLMKTGDLQEQDEINSDEEGEDEHVGMIALPPPISRRALVYGYLNCQAPALPADTKIVAAKKKYRRLRDVGTSLSLPHSNSSHVSHEAQQHAIQNPTATIPAPLTPSDVAPDVSEFSDGLLELPEDEAAVSVTTTTCCEVVLVACVDTVAAGIEEDVADAVAIEVDERIVTLPASVEVASGSVVMSEATSEVVVGFSSMSLAVIRPVVTTSVGSRTDCVVARDGSVARLAMLIILAALGNPSKTVPTTPELVDPVVAAVDKSSPLVVVAPPSPTSSRRLPTRFWRRAYWDLRNPDCAGRGMSAMRNSWSGDVVPRTSPSCGEETYRASNFPG